MFKKVVIAIGLATVATSANAAPVLFEDFEGTPGVFALDGNVQLANGAIYNSCCGTPMDTSNTFAAFGYGNLTSGTLSATFETLIDHLYTVSFDYGALGGGTETLTFAVMGQSFGFNPIANNDMTLQSGSFSFFGTGQLATLSVASAGADYVDAIVDNISMSASAETVRVSAQSAVPEPATWAMMFLGFGLIGGAMRSAARRQKVTVTYA
jgi:hypothetical protein